MSDQKYAIIAKNISKRYKMYKNSKEKLLDLISPKGCGADFFALKDLSFKVEKGKSVGLIGVNGAGKSTLSNILAGVSIPTTGEIQINGQPAIIAIGSGLNNFLTGLENIEMKALMMGFDKEKIEEIKQNVIEFAEIGEFINQPIRTYSSGMRSRLGFAISIHIDPDIVIIDEALSVGDPTFTSKCLDKMNEFKQNGKTIFFVSHSISQVREFCDEAIWLEYGMIKDQGPVEKILPKYQEYLKMINKMNATERKKFKDERLKEQNHHLLREFKLIDPKYKKLKLTGNLIKYSKLVDKKGNYKVIPYNFDYKMFLLGSISYFIKKQYMYGLFILTLELIAIFVAPELWGIFSRFLLTFILALFTGKKYTNELIENKGYIPYEFYKDEVESLNDSSIPKVSSKNINSAIRKENKLFMILSIVALLTVSGMVYIYSKKFENIKDTSNIDTEVIKPAYVNERVLLVVEYDGMARKFAFLDISNESIVCEYYPGELLVKYNNEIKNLNDIYIKQGCIPTEVIEGTLNKKGYTQISIDEKYLKEKKIAISGDVYKRILENLIVSENNTLLNEINSKDVDSITTFKVAIESIKEKYKTELGKRYRAQRGSYKYKSIEEITSAYIIRYYALDRNVKYYYINDADLEAYEDVVRIRELERRQLELSQENETTGNSIGSGSGNSSGGSTGSGSGNSSGGSTGSGSGNNSGGSTGSGSGNNSGGSTGSGSGNNSGGSTDSGTEDNSGGSTDSGTGDNSGGSTDSGTGDNSGGSTDSGTEDNSGESTNQDQGTDSEGSTGSEEINTQ